jgi:hypothetical protein
MAIESPGSTDLEAQREELQTVLRSEHFTRAPMLARLLSYLCEKLFAGEARQIKEYTVGVEVFQRDPSYDQNSDSIVRVEANRLRKRLDAYYAGPGSSNRLRITIPLGQYVPEFKTAAPPRAEREPVPSEPPAASQSGPESAAIGPTATRIRISGYRIGQLAAVLALLALALGYAWIANWQTKQVQPAAVLNEPTSSSADPQVGPPMGEEIRILAGSGRSFVDHAGKLWNADTWFEGGTTAKSSAQFIWRTQCPDLYRSSRQGQFHYAIPLKNGIYELRLHFVETVFDPESTPTGGEGSRLMTVRANGKTLLTRFDIVADAGASRTADVKVFTGISPAADGLLHLDFSGDDGKQASLSAIEILPGFRGHIRPVRILARQTPYYSNDSRWWSPDTYSEGGQLATYATPVRGTDDPELFETERWGNFTYAIPVTPGKYAVTLYFAVRHGDWDESPSQYGVNGAPVAHIFDVSCNGIMLLKNFDLVREARQTDVVIRKASGLEPNAQGKLLFNFIPVEGYATVSGIEVLPQ